MLLLLFHAAVQGKYSCCIDVKHELLMLLLLFHLLSWASTAVVYSTDSEELYNLPRRNISTSNSYL